MTRSLVSPILIIVVRMILAPAPSAHGDDATALAAVRKEVMRPYTGTAPVAIDRDGLEGRVLCGYQGWFTTPDDGAELGWHHWRTPDRPPQGGSMIAVDMLPDMSELPPDERFATDLAGSDGKPIEVFSSHRRPTVLRHFSWMREYGIDGVFVQRFAVNLRHAKLLAHSTQVLDSCREGAVANGRVYAVMYDLTGLGEGKVSTVLEDWRELRGRMGIGDDPAAMHVNGKPLVAIWGIGFDGDRNYSLAECRELIATLEAEGCAVMCGVPTGWRTLSRDAVRDAALHEVVALCDVVCPWTVGRYSTRADVTRHADRDWKADIAWCEERGLQYMPVIFPGFSWHNLTGGELGQIPRRGGEFFWQQAVDAQRIGAQSLYVAMFDEVDEATAIFKCVDPPPALADRFLGLEGKPSDHYLRLTGEIGRLLRGDRSHLVDPAR